MYVYVKIYTCTFCMCVYLTPAYMQYIHAYLDTICRIADAGPWPARFRRLSSRRGAVQPDRRRRHLAVHRPVGRGRHGSADSQPGGGPCATRSLEASSHRPPASGRTGSIDCHPGGGPCTGNLHLIAGVVVLLSAGPWLSQRSNVMCHVDQSLN